MPTSSPISFRRRLQFADVLLHAKNGAARKSIEFACVNESTSFLKVAHRNSSLDLRAAAGGAGESSNKNQVKRKRSDLC